MSKYIVRYNCINKHTLKNHVIYSKNVTLLLLSSSILLFIMYIFIIISIKKYQQPTKIL